MCVCVCVCVIVHYYLCSYGNMRVVGDRSDKVGQPPLDWTSCSRCLSGVIFAFSCRISWSLGDSRDAARWVASLICWARSFSSAFLFSLEIWITVRKSVGILSQHGTRVEDVVSVNKDHARRSYPSSLRLAFLFLFGRSGTGTGCRCCCCCCCC